MTDTQRVITYNLQKIFSQGHEILNTWQNNDFRELRLGGEIPSTGILNITKWEKPCCILVCVVVYKLMNLHLNIKLLQPHHLILFKILNLVVMSYEIMRPQHDNYVGEDWKNNWRIKGKSEICKTVQACHWNRATFHVHCSIELVCANLKCTGITIISVEKFWLKLLN